MCTIYILIFEHEFVGVVLVCIFYLCGTSPWFSTFRFFPDGHCPLPLHAFGVEFPLVRSVEEKSGSFGMFRGGCVFDDVGVVDPDYFSFPHDCFELFRWC